MFTLLIKIGEFNDKDFYSSITHCSCDAVYAWGEVGTMCWQIRSHPKSYTRTESMTNYDSLSPQKETNMTMENLPWHLAFMTKSSLKPKLHSRLCLPIFYSDIVKHYYPSLHDGNHGIILQIWNWNWNNLVGQCQVFWHRIKIDLLFTKCIWGSQLFPFWRCGYLLQNYFK